MEVEQLHISTLDKTKFENIEYEEWRRLVQFVLNYDLWLSNIEKLDKLILNKLQLEKYIACRGIMPSDIVPKVERLDEMLAEAKKIKQEVEISEFDTAFKVKGLDKLQTLEKELNLRVIHQGKIVNTKRRYLFWQNPYFLKGDDQMFNKRLPSLKNELKNIKWIIKKELKPQLKKSIRMMNLIELEFRRILNVPKDKDVRPLFDFVRPYLNEIVTSDSSYFQELLALALAV